MTGEINKGSLALILVAFLAVSSCGRNVVFTDSVVMPGNVWPLSMVPEFTVPVTDTTTASNLLFTLRTGSDYPFRNIYLFVTATSPNGKDLTDTLEYNLADEKGNWYGRGFGDINELNLPYKTNVFFPVKGTYRFKIQHGMRIGDLKGVYDLGFKIEKTGNK